MEFFLGVVVLLAGFLQPTHALPQHHDTVPRGSSGCGKSSLFPGITQYRFLKSSGKDRSYSYHVPSSYNVDKPYPVVVGFHGSTSIGAFFELDTKMSQERYSADKIMIYPNGIGGSWAGPSYHSGSTVAEDIAFVRDVIEDAKGRLCIDESKVFGAG
jgi:poly(3-hydroxybutyrate) depolymerase